jgi:hypothetical protein
VVLENHTQVMKLDFGNMTESLGSCILDISLMLKLIASTLNRFAFSIMLLSLFLHINLKHLDGSFF